MPKVNFSFFHLIIFLLSFFKNSYQITHNYPTTVQINQTPMNTHLTTKLFAYSLMMNLTLIIII